MWFVATRATALALVVIIATGCAAGRKVKSGGDDETSDSAAITIEYVPIAIGWVKKYVIATPADVAAWAKTPPGKAALRAKLRHVLVRVPASATAKQVSAARKKALELSARVEAGEKIQTVAADTSDDDTSRDRGGALDDDESTLDEPLRTLAKTLGPGEMSSEPVRTPAGFHVVMRDRADKGEPEKAYKKARAAEMARKLADEMLRRMQASSEPLDEIAIASITAVLDGAAVKDSSRRKAVSLSPERARDADLPPDAKEALASFARKAKAGDVVDSALGTGPVLVVARAVKRVD